jgi:endonuclease/exonuclease/phosphatase family metal-dependent hydrolase
MKSKTFSRLIVFVSLSLLFIGLGIFSAASQDKITRKTINAMSFNIRYDNPKDNENAWPNRKEMVAATIRFHQTDIAGLQEALDHQVKDLEALLPEYGWFGVGRDDGRNKGEYAPVFFRKGRFTVVHWDTFWLSDTPDKPAKAWDAALPRIVTWGKIQDIWTGKIFFFFNTHFDHVGETAREKSAKLLQKKIAEISEDFPVILTGDFNCTEKENPYKTLTSGNGQKPTLTDVYARSASSGAVLFRKNGTGGSCPTTTRCWQRSYSYRRESTGSAVAALTVCKAIVIKAINIARDAAKTNTHTPISIL